MKMKFRFRRLILRESFFKKILQRESEEIENNEAEDAEGLNEEIKKNDEVESVGNEEVTEEISGKPFSILFH